MIMVRSVLFDRRTKTSNYMALRSDTQLFIARTFTGPDRTAAFLFCRSATMEAGSPASPRLIRCALVSGGGSMERLRIEIAHPRINWRDVIMSGEYVSKDGRFTQVRKFNEPFDDAD